MPRTRIGARLWELIRGRNPGRSETPGGAEEEPDSSAAASPDGSELAAPEAANMGTTSARESSGPGSAAPPEAITTSVFLTREWISRATGSRILDRALGLENSRLNVFGWIQNSFTGNPSLSTDGTNFGVTPNHLANQWMGNQYYLVVERPVDKSDSVNFGFRTDLLLGNDWQFNHMHGLFDSAFVLNSFAGFDPAQFYASIHLPILTRLGLDIRGGRWYALGGSEGVPALSRPLLSVPYMFNYGQPFTHFGVLSVLHLSENLHWYNGAINGWDRWVDENYHWGYVGSLRWAANDYRTQFAMTGIWGPNQFPRFLPANTQIFPDGYVNIPSLAGAVNPGYARNDRTLLTWVLSHRWTDKLTQNIETDQGWEHAIPGLASGGRNGAPANDEWYSFGNWFLYSFRDNLMGVWRSEWFRDVAGSRTGFPGNFYEMTLGMIVKPRPWLLIRPEIRFDWSQFSHPFDNGTQSHQLTLAVDMILRF
jgi:hypothetical protein